MAAFPDQCVNRKFKSDSLFPTRSSGSSGQTLLIRVDYDAILTDTIQGVRQFAMQSGNDYRENDLLAHVYTVPWWYDSIGGKYPTAFISNLIPPARVAQHLRYLAPRTLSLYPSNLDALMPHVDEFKSTLNVVVTHSEYSSKAQRQEWSRQLGVPVLDEYSSEEATRIALEMPDGHYYVCEDTVHLDVLDPVTMEPQVAGQSGIAVITNLLNEAMPFIRYVQGDYITLPVKPGALRDQLVADRQHRRPSQRCLHQLGRPQGPGRQHPRCDLSLDVRLRPASGAVRDCADRGRYGGSPRRARRRHVEGQAARLDPAFGRPAFDLPGRHGSGAKRSSSMLPAESRQAPADPPRDGLSSSQRGYVS